MATKRHKPKAISQVLKSDDVKKKTSLTLGVSQATEQLLCRSTPWISTVYIEQWEWCESDSRA